MTTRNAVVGHRAASVSGRRPEAQIGEGGQVAIVERPDRRVRAKPDQGDRRILEAAGPARHGVEERFEMIKILWIGMDDVQTLPHRRQGRSGSRDADVVHEPFVDLENDRQRRGERSFGRDELVESTPRIGVMTVATIEEPDQRPRI